MAKKYEYSYKTNETDCFINIKHDQLLRKLGATEEQIKGPTKQTNWLTYAFKYGQTGCLSRQMVSHNIVAIKQVKILTGEVSIYSLNIMECVNIPPKKQFSQQSEQPVKKNPRSSKVTCKPCVYILTNPCFQEYVKIGYATNLHKRLKELDNTSTPKPFECYAYIETSKYKELEKTIHHILDILTNYRVRPNREFWEISPETVLDIMYAQAGLIDDSNVVKC